MAWTSCGATAQQRRHFDFSARRARNSRGGRPPAPAPAATSRCCATAEVLPLFARLSQAEQDRIFDGHSQRRIVLATNVAETSLTVPGIKYVIDAGTARVKRYSFRSKVEQLLVEPISQAAPTSAPGAAGAWPTASASACTTRPISTSAMPLPTPKFCALAGRGHPAHEVAAPGRCGEDFPLSGSPLGPGDCRWLPAAQELGAVDDARRADRPWARSCPPAAGPARGPHDCGGPQPRALAEVLVIAAALSVQDVRDRPLEAQAQADQAARQV
jgi:ATP-dependent helicase HrpA